jgi:hypothetical protein
LEQLDHLFAEGVPTRAFRRYRFEDDVVPVEVGKGGVGGEEAGKRELGSEDGKEKSDAEVDVRPLDK